jgi:hypothetical protein
VPGYRAVLNIVNHGRAVTGDNRPGLLLVKELAVLLGYQFGTEGGLNYLCKTQPFQSSDQLPRTHTGESRRERRPENGNRRGMLAEQHPEVTGIALKPLGALAANPDAVAAGDTVLLDDFCQAFLYPDSMGGAGAHTGVTAFTLITVSENNSHLRRLS